MEVAAIGRALGGLASAAPLPSRRCFAALAIGALVVALEPAAGFAVDGGILFAFVLDVLLARRLGLPEIDVAVRARMAQGQEEVLGIHLANRTGRRLVLRLAADVPEELAGPRAADVRDVTLEPGERASVPIGLAAKRRGEHAIGALHVRMLAPLRLAWHRARLPLERRVEVVPGLREIRSYRLLAQHHHLHQAGLRNVRQRGEGGAFESLREYVRGDDPRRIDWKASARHGKPIVRQYEAERNQSIVLCVDTGRLMGEIVSGRERLDHALAAAVVLCEIARVWNDSVGVFAFSDRVHAVLPPARHPPGRVPSLFAKLESRSVEPDYPRALVHLSRLVTRRSLLVFFGDVIDEEVSAPLAAQLARLARRHLALLVAMRHTDLVGASLAPAPDLAAAYRRAAATELVLARARLLARMRESGIHVADVPPEGAVAAAVNRYIEIKRRGLL